MVAREDWLLGVIGVQQVHMMLYQLFVESNQPLPPSGVKQWSAKLTDRQRRRCAGLPAPRADRDTVIEAMRESALVFRAEAQAILGANDVTWPEALDSAVREQQARTLGWAVDASVQAEN